MGKSKEKLFSQSNLNLLKEEADKWFKYFGLIDFDLKVKIDSENYEDNLAVATCDFIAKSAVIKISKCWPDYYLNAFEVKLTAFHEVCEIMLGRLRALADGKFSDTEVNETIHSVINRLQNTIFIDSLKKKPKKHKI